MTVIPENEVLRYLGVSRAEEPLCAEVRSVCQNMEQCITPRSVWQEYPCSVADTSVSFGGITFDGTDLVRHLKGCSSLLLFAATLGVEADRMARMESLARGSMVHAAGAAMIEQYCDDVQETLSTEYEARGLYLRPRYSPGYGDWDLSMQKEFLRTLNAEKKIGLCLNSSLLLTPLKSVTAAIGLENKDAPRIIKKKDCTACNLFASCAYRKGGTTCGH